MTGETLKIADLLRRGCEELVAVLLYGPDAGLSRHWRKRLLENVLGERSGDVFSIVWLEGREVRSDPGRIVSACKERGFFDAGRRVVVMNGAGDPNADGVAEAFAQADLEDSLLIVCAGDLEARSPLLRRFTSERRAAILCAKMQAMSASGIAQAFRSRDAPEPDEDAAACLVALSEESDWSSFDHLIERIALFLVGTSGPFGVDAVDACAGEAWAGRDRQQIQIDALVDAIAEGRQQDVARRGRQLMSAGIKPTTLAIAASRHFLMVHSALSRAGRSSRLDGVVMRLPMHPSRRAPLADQAARLSIEQVEQALRCLDRSDVELRWKAYAPDWPVLERGMMRAAAACRH